MQKTKGGLPLQYLIKKITKVLFANYTREFRNERMYILRSLRGVCNTSADVSHTAIEEV